MGFKIEDKPRHDTVHTVGSNYLPGRREESSTFSINEEDSQGYFEK